MPVTIVLPESHYADDYLFGIFGLSEGDEVTITETTAAGEQSILRVADDQGTVHTTFPTSDSGPVTLRVSQGLEVLAEETFEVAR